MGNGSLGSSFVLPSPQHEEWGCGTRAGPQEEQLPSVSLISQISQRTVLPVWQCPVLTVENCLKHSAVILPGLLDGSWFSCPPSPISYTLQSSLFLSFTQLPLSFSHHLSLAYLSALIPTKMWPSLIISPPLTLFFLIGDNHILFYFPLGIMFCTDSRDLFIAFRSCSGLLTWWFLI